MASLDKEQVIEKFTNAYESAKGKKPDIDAKGGWYSVDGGKKVRLAALNELADELTSGGAAEKADVKVKKAAPKKQKTGFSVKQFWTDKITNENSGAIKPR